MQSLGISELGRTVINFGEIHFMGLDDWEELNHFGVISGNLVIFCYTEISGCSHIFTDFDKTWNVQIGMKRTI